MRSEAKRFDVIVIGGGASGLMAAGRAAARGKSVLLLEKNPKVGKKLDITGGGRCNITNAEFDPHVLLKQNGKAEQFLYSPFSQFGVESTFDFFTERELPLVVEANKRAFPASHRASDVTLVLKKYCEDAGVIVRTKSSVSRLEMKGDRIEAAVCGTARYVADSFVLATGGNSHAETGSTGEGFRWLEKAGHMVVAPTPTLVPLRIRDAWVKKLAGTSLSSMKITFFSNGVRAFSKRGRLLFTHFGVSGPLILNSAGAVQDLLAAGSVSCTIDAFPDTDFAALEKKVLAVIEANKNKTFKNVLADIVPPGMSSAYFGLLHMSDPALKAHSLSKKDRKRFVHLLKATPAEIEGLMGYDRAIVSDGGVPLTEVDTRTFKSLKVSNLYLVGDVLHISRPSGGYSLQLCWTSGYVAGSSV